MLSNTNGGASTSLIHIGGVSFSELDREAFIVLLHHLSLGTLNVLP